MRMLLALVCISAIVHSAPLLAGQKPGTAVLVAAGDVEWSGRGGGRPAAKSGGVVYDDEGKELVQGGWQPIPRFLTPADITRLRAQNDPLIARLDSIRRDQASANARAYGTTPEHLGDPSRGRQVFSIDFDSAGEWARDPFQKIGALFRSADIGFVNLETPLSDRPYLIAGLFRTPTAFAEGMKGAGITVASIANNHSLDAERQGLIDTRDALLRAGIAGVGGGENLEEARKPVILERNGVRFAFLAYTQYVNNTTGSAWDGATGFAGPENAGVAPMDPAIIKEDIGRVRARADHVILSFHWDIYSFDPAKNHYLHPRAVAFAHEMIDAGADVILGHHPHFVRAVEVYRGKPILYSMSHLIFSLSYPRWKDNYVARLTFSKGRVEMLELLPVAGIGRDVTQPYLLQGERAHALLRLLQELSSELGTSIDVVGDKGVVRLR